MAPKSEGGRRITTTFHFNSPANNTPTIVQILYTYTHYSKKYTVNKTVKTSPAIITKMWYQFNDIKLLVCWHKIWLVTIAQPLSLSLTDTDAHIWGHRECLLGTYEWFSPWGHLRGSDWWTGRHAHTNTHLAVYFVLSKSVAVRVSLGSENGLACWQLYPMRNSPRVCNLQRINWIQQWTANE